MIRKVCSFVYSHGLCSPEYVNLWEIGEYQKDDESGVQLSISANSKLAIMEKYNS